MSLGDSYDAFLCDLDGVVWLGHEFLPGSVETINRLTAGDKPVCFVTNNPRLAPADQAALLRQGGIELEDTQVVSAASTLIRLATERYGEGAPVLGVGTGSFLEQLVAGGFELLPQDDASQAKAVLVSGHRDFDYEQLKAASMLVRAGAGLLATSRDPTMPMPDGLWPGTGAVLASIEVASGRTATTTGKPAPALFEAGLDVLGRPSGRVAMIGDRLDTDIAGAQACGLDGILVTGDHPRDQDPESGTKPNHRIKSLAELLI